RHLVATTKVIEPTRGTIGILQRLRRALIGFPLASAELPHERVSKFKGLALFASDALSSSAYSVEEVLLILVLAGTVALNFALPVAIAIAILIAIVVTSYRQTIR